MTCDGTVTRARVINPGEVRVNVDGSSARAYTSLTSIVRSDKTQHQLSVFVLSGGDLAVYRQGARLSFLLPDCSQLLSPDLSLFVMAKGK